MTTITETQENLARNQLIDALIAQTAPEKTGTFCFDGFEWEKDKPTLQLHGDHGTPDFRLEFLKGGAVRVTPNENSSWGLTVGSTYKDFQKLAQDILATMIVILIRMGK